MLVIINFKDTPELKRALRIASAKAGYPDVSKFLSALVRENQHVTKELKNISKKDR